MRQVMPCAGLGWVCLLLLVACGSGCAAEESRPGDELARKVRGMRDPGPSTRFDNTGLQVQSFDLNGDGVADLWKIFSDVRENIDDVRNTVRLVRKEVDSNFDGEVDLWFHYNMQESLHREEADTTFNGHVDMVSCFEKGRLVRREIYHPDFEYPVAVKSYRDGRLTKIERDRNGDGITDLWEIYDHGRLVQVGHDQVGNGRVDYWENY